MIETVMGLETEYGLVTFKGDIWYTDRLGKLMDLSGGFNISAQKFFENGSMIMRDNSIYEFATPECVSATDVILYSRAGDLQLQNLIFSYSNEYPNMKKFIAIRNNIDSQGNTFGAHESYLLRRSGFEQDPSLPEDYRYKCFLLDKLGGLIPFLISRQIFAGTGYIFCNNYNNHFFLSQRSSKIRGLCSLDTTMDRAIINTKNDPLADKDKYARLHLILGDSNICEFAERLKFGTISLMIKLCEEGLLERWFLNLEKDPVEILHGINNDLNYKIQIGKKEFTALDIQKKYFELADKYYSYWSEEDKIILEDWGNTLDWLSNIENNIEELLGRIDWITKLFLLTKGSLDINKINFKDENSKKRAEELDISYHCLNENSVYSLIKKQEWFKKHRILTDEQITKALTEPPKTRAFIRGKFVKYLKELNEKKSYKNYNIYWDKITLCEKKIRFPEPFYREEDEKYLDDLIVEITKGGNMDISPQNLNINFFI